MAHSQNERPKLKAEVFKAMGHPLRFGVIGFLQGGERCVCEIVEEVGTEISNVPKHLSALEGGYCLQPQRRPHLRLYQQVVRPSRRWI